MCRLLLYKEPFLPYSRDNKQEIVCMQLHCHSFLLLLIKLIDFSYKTAFSPFYCIISPHPHKLGTNRAVGTSRSRCRGCRRRRCHRYGVREDILLIQVVFTKKVQMKRCVTGDDADGCCPQRKSPCPTLVGRKTKALSGKADSDGVHVDMFIQ